MYYTSNFPIYMRLSRPLHMHETFGKEKVHCRREKKINTRATTIVSGAKNIVNQPKKQLKSSKLGAEGAENSVISAPILGKSCARW